MVSRQLNGTQLYASFPNFCLGRPFRFSSYRDSICLVSNFFLDRPFGFSIHRDAHFLPKLPFQVFNLASFSSSEVLFDYVRIHRVWEILAIHSGKQHGTAGEYFLDYKWSLISGSPLAPGVTLWQDDAFDNQATNLVCLTFDFFVEGFDHTLLVQLTMTNSCEPLFINQVYMVQPSLNPIVFI